MLKTIGSKLFLMLLPLLLVQCSCDKGKPRSTTTGGSKMAVRTTIEIKSSAFTDGGKIPVEYTCDGAGISPDLSWSNVPPETKSLVLICDDPDAPMGTFTHWVMYNIPPKVNNLPAGTPAEPKLDNGALQGINSARKIGYTPPCPPSGTHRYIFTIYALDTVLNLEPGVQKSEVEQAMEGHILAEGRIIGKYSRR
jgi:Raf kinase inhibitor-like YbhB/YbcL family protein